MTLETAKQIIQEQGEQASKEALAVVRGGMTICENKEDGSRKYLWIKVKPTKNDEESSIDAALKKHHEMYFRRPTKVKEESASQENNSLSESNNSTPEKEENEEMPHPSFLERLKKKVIEIWQKIDEIVIE